MEDADTVLNGGLRPGAQHEVFAEDWGANGFAACLAIRAMGKKPLFWIRPDYAAMEYGALSATGFLELGGDPEKLLLLRAANTEDALSATADILACPHIGAVVLELEGQASVLDLAASRRLGRSRKKAASRFLSCAKAPMRGPARPPRAGKCEA